MAITTIGIELLKKIAPHQAKLGDLLGSSRVENLTKDERKALIKKYNLSDNWDLVLGNATRGAVGAGLGGIAGTGVGALLGTATCNPIAFIGLSTLGNLAGITLGARKATEKYSRKALES